MPTRHAEQVVPLPLDETFRFFEDPYNLLKITPPGLNLKVTNPERVVMGKGAEITYRIRWMGLPLSWRTVIREYDPPHSFSDSQLNGPYKKWDHHHAFVAEGDCSTRIIDDVDYELPFGILGRVFGSWLIRKQLDGIFAYRDKRIRELLG